MARGILIVNPFASGVSEKRVAQVEGALGGVVELETQFTQRAGHGTELAREACRSGGLDAIFVLSGDGGFNEVVNGMDRDVPVGFLPGGGTSVLPRALGLPADPVAAARRLADAVASVRVRTISLGRVNGRRFTFAAGIGFDAEAVRRVDAIGRGPDGRRPSDLRFAAAVARMVIQERGRYDPALEVIGRGRAAFALVGNCTPYTYVKGLPLTLVPGASFELGLDLIAPIHVRPSGILRLVRYALRGHGQEHDPEVLYAHDADLIEIVCDAPMPLHADGEDLGDVGRAVFEAERQALTVLV